MQLLVNSRFPVARDSEDDFLVPILVDIRSRGTQDFRHALLGPSARQAGSEASFSNHREPGGLAAGGEFLVGRMWLEKLLVSDAEDAGYSMLLVSDAASAAWLQVVETLTRKGGQRFRRDLKLDSFIDDIVYLHEIVLHPDIKDRVPLVDAAIRATAGPGSLIVTSYLREADRPLTDREYRDLGFRKIASSDLLLRDNRLRYPFGDQHPSGKSVEFRASAEHEAWMLDKWQTLNIGFDL